MIHPPSIWCSKYYLFFTISCKILCKNSFNLIFNFFNKFTKIKIKSCKCRKSIRYYIKKIMLGTSDAWLMSHSSRRTSKPAYYIVDCRISKRPHTCPEEIFGSILKIFTSYQSKLQSLEEIKWFEANNLFVTSKNEFTNLQNLGEIIGKLI